MLDRQDGSDGPREATDVGTFQWPLRITDLSGERSVEVEALVDTGAFYTALPARILHELGVEPIYRRRLRLADGRLFEADVGEARATINGESVTTLVAFGEEGSPPLLGAYTLEGLTLAVDPTARRLVPQEMIMYATCAA